MIGVTSSNSNNNMSMRTNIAEASVKSDNNVVLNQFVTTTAQPPFVLTVAGMDHDFGDPDEAASKITKGLQSISAKLTVALGVFMGDPTIGAYAQSFVDIFGDWVGDGVSLLFGMGDDVVGTNSMQFFAFDPAAAQWLTPKPRIHADFDEPHNVELALNNGEGGGYIAFFNVQLFNDLTTPVASS